MVKLREMGCLGGVVVRGVGWCREESCVEWHGVEGGMR